MNCTIDASVFVSAVRLEEDHYTVSREFVRQAQKGAVTVLCPTLALPLPATMGRQRSGDKDR